MLHEANSLTLTTELKEPKSFNYLLVKGHFNAITKVRQLFYKYFGCATIGGFIHKLGTWIFSMLYRNLKLAGHELGSHFEELKNLSSEKLHFFHNTIFSLPGSGSRVITMLANLPLDEICHCLPILKDLYRWRSELTFKRDFQTG